MNKVYNNDNARRYVHMALSRQIKSMEAANSSSGETTIDDVVKFIHDNINDELFSYTTYEEIPSTENVLESDSSSSYVRGTADEIADFLTELQDSQSYINHDDILHLNQYNIIFCEFTNPK